MRGSSRAMRSQPSGSTQCRVGRPENWGSDPASFDQVRPSCYDVDERVRDMNVNGTLASINFPSWPGSAASSSNATMTTSTWLR